MKRSLCVILALVMIMGAFATIPITVSAVDVDDMVFELKEDGESYSVVGCDEYAEGELVIPDTYNGLPVTTIGDHAFRDCYNLTAITIGKNVTSIGDSAFALCDSLLSINVNSKNTRYASVDGILLNKNKTTLVAFPAGKTSCVIPSSVTTIGDYAFSYCFNLTTISIPDSVTIVDEGAFSYCRYLNSVTIGDGVTNIGESAFYDCIALTSLTIGDSVKHISRGAFSDCDSLVSITIPDSVTSIDSYAFSFCKSLSSISINNASVDYDAFFKCENLKTVKIGAGVTSLSDYSFYCCKSLKSISVDENNKYYSSEDGILFNKDKTTLIQYPAAKNNTSYTIPVSVNTMGSDAFFQCTNLTSINVDKNNEYYSSKDGILFNKDKTTIIRYPAGKNDDSYTIPKSVTNIGYRAFASCKSLLSIIIPYGITNIDYATFSYCDSLVNITIPNSVTSIGYVAFEGCTNLKSILIPDSVTTIDSSAFYDCRSLTSITIGESVTSIGDYAFENCISLTDVYYIGTEADWENITIGIDNDCLTDATIHYHEHSFSGDWVIDSEPTCTEAGSKHDTCSGCGGVVTKSIPKLGHTESSWKIDINATVYKAGSKHKECNECGEILKTATIKQLKCSKPTLKSIENTKYGVLTKWGTVKGADKYRVYRKTSKTDWEYIGSTTNTYYTDKTAKSGTKYYYAVRARNEAGNSSFSGSLSKYNLADPTLNTPSTTTKGVGLRWSKVTGASGYMVYRRTTDGSYKLISTEEGVSNVTYRDTTAKKGTKYYYKVKAYKSKTYSAYSNTKAITDKY